MNIDLVQVLRTSPQLGEQAAPLASALTPIILEGISKAASRVDGMIALLAAAHIAAAHSQVDGQLAKDKVRFATLSMALMRSGQWNFLLNVFRHSKRAVQF